MEQSAINDVHFHMRIWMFSANDDTGPGDQGILAEEACLLITLRRSALRMAWWQRPALQVPMSPVIAEPSWRVKVFGLEAGCGVSDGMGPGCDAWRGKI